MEGDVADKDMPAEVSGQFIDLFTLEAFAIAEPHHKQLCQLNILLHIFTPFQP
jgi:hypothetical protein